MSVTRLLLHLPLALFSTFNLASASIDTALNEHDFHTRRMKLLRRDDIDFDSLPECARPYCNATAALSPSRLGCIEASLTKDCLCNKAVVPLLCVKSGPSSEDNCWYDTENWYAGQCDNKVPLVPRTSMPSCLADCATNWLRKQGCRTDTRNCFCKLETKAVVPAVESCRKGSCMKHMQPGFDVAFWREQICSQGDVDNYNQGAYEARKKMVKTIRIVVPIFVVIISIFIVSCGIGVCLDEEKSDAALLSFIIASALILLVIVPIFVAI